MNSNLSLSLDAFKHSNIEKAFQSDIQKTKADVPKEHLKEMIKEHERLVDVLDSPSHEDDKKESKKQKKELKEYKQELKKAFDILGTISQQVIDQLEKGRKGVPVGTVRKYGNREYIKTSKGWRYNTQGGGGEELKFSPKAGERQFSPAEQKYIKQVLNSGLNRKQLKKELQIRKQMVQQGSGKAKVEVELIEYALKKTKKKFKIF